MAVGKGSIVSEIYSFLGDVTQRAPRLSESAYAYVKDKNGLSYKRYYDTIYRMQKRGALQVSITEGKKFLALTRKGALEALLASAHAEHPKAWDHKWRLIIFDIPEAARHERNKLRALLLQHGFMKLQASVFISPFPLAREAIVYLKNTGLISYIRILRVDEMDYDADLRRKFHLSS